jgi:hypothetical protein
MVHSAGPVQHLACFRAHDAAMSVILFSPAPGLDARGTLSSSFRWARVR